jgi:tetratricopeptide (TPR) repeat protein
VPRLRAFLPALRLRRVVFKTCLLIVIAAPTASSGLSQQLPVSIQGHIHTGDGSPLPNDITVRLETAEEASMAQQFVGIDGKFEFRNLKEGLYRLRVTAKGYKTALQDVDTHWCWYGSCYENIYLVPEDTKETPGPPSRTVASTDLAAPKKARKAYEKGRAALQKGNSEEARQQLEKAVAEYPCFARALTSLGVARSFQRQFEPAESSLKKALECDSGYLEAYLQLAILLNVERKYAKNIANLRTALGHFPGEWQLYEQLGAAEGGAGRYSEAEQAFAKAESLNPTLPPEFHLKVAERYVSWKQYDKARAEMQAYLAAEPNGRFAEETRRTISYMESSGLVSSP